MARSRDDDDDRPARRDKEKSGGNLVLIIGLLAGGGLLFVALAVVAVFVYTAESPQRAFEDLKGGFLNGNWGKVYDRMDKEQQAKFEQGAEGLNRGMGPNAQFAGKRGKELFVAMMAEEEARGYMTAQLRESFRNAKVTKVEAEGGDEATLTIRMGDGGGSESKVKVVKQDGRWRFQGKSFGGF